MAEVNTSVTVDQEGEPLLSSKGNESWPSEPPASTAPEPLRPSTTRVPPNGEEAREPMPAPNTSARAAVGWPDMLEELGATPSSLKGTTLLWVWLSRVFGLSNPN